MFGAIYHYDTRNILKIAFNGSKILSICHIKAILLWISLHNISKYVNTLGLSILVHVILSLSDASSFDKQSIKVHSSASYINIKENKFVKHNMLT